VKAGAEITLFALGRHTIAFRRTAFSVVKGDLRYTWHCR